MMYAALQLEVLGLFKVVDRNVEIFMNGQLPVANDMGGTALNAYYWDSVNRMSESARWMQYSRILGAKGGEISREVQPNTAFDELFMRFLSALSEYQRQQRLADLLGNQRGLSLTGEHVRKAGRDVGANCTLFGYGYTQFAARRIQHHIQSAMTILKLVDVQQAWGVSNAWQVVERVSSQEFKVTPNVVKYRTMAESGKKILDLVASNSAAWSASSNKPLFQEPGAAQPAPAPAVDVVGRVQRMVRDGQPLSLAQLRQMVGSSSGSSDISPEDQATFLRHTEYWLAVNGVQDQTVAQSAQPSETAYAPSIPSIDGTASGAANADIAGQIQHMLQQGQTPSPDQLRQMVGV
jgi:hypothetical protein